jgi:hypothetical protein
MSGALWPADLEMFARFGVPPEVLEELGICRVTDREARFVFGIRGGGDMSGIAYPYFNPSTMANGRQRWYVRIRRDHPDIEDGKIRKKYVSPFGDRKHLYFPPRPDLFPDATVPIVLVESEKAVLAMLAWSERVDRKILPLGLGGVWGWRGQLGITTTATGERAPQTGPLPDLNICRGGRKVYVLLDSNSSSNPSVMKARNDLVRQLRKQGAVVHVLDLPAGEGVNGPDDYIGVHGDEAMAKLFDGIENGPKVVEEMKALIQRYVIMSEAQALVVTLWTIHTYLFPGYRGSTGYLHISSPVEECGKSQLLEVVELFAANPTTVGGATPAALIRVIDKESPTFLLDEADLNMHDKEMSALLCSIFNNGWRPGRPYLKCDGEKHDLRRFSVYGPKGICGIGTHYMAPATLSRCFPIRLQRHGGARMAEEYYIDKAEEESAPIKKKLTVWAGQRKNAWLANKRPGRVPPWLHSRKGSISFPLFAIAEDLGGTYPSRLADAMEEIFVGKSGKARLSYKIQLLSDIQAVFNDLDRDVLETLDLLRALCEIETSPWAEASNGKPLTPHKLALLLSDFGPAPGQHWIGGTKIRGYARDDFRAAWDGYLPAPAHVPTSKSVETVEGSIHAGLEQFPKSVEQADSTDSKNAGSVNVYAGSTDSTDSTRGVRVLGDKKSWVGRVQCPGCHGDFGAEYLEDHLRDCRAYQNRRAALERK